MELAIARHECGHGLVALHYNLKIHTISGYGCTQVLSAIEPWGYALGQAYDTDPHGTRRALTVQCAVLLAGCVVGGQPFWGSHDARQLEQFAAAWDDVVRNHRPQVLPQWSVILQDAERTVQRWWTTPGTPDLVEAVARELTRVEQLTGAQWQALVSRWRARLGLTAGAGTRVRPRTRPTVPPAMERRKRPLVFATDPPGPCYTPPQVPAGFRVRHPPKQGAWYA